MSLYPRMCDILTFSSPILAAWDRWDHPKGILGIDALDQCWNANPKRHHVTGTERVLADGFQPPFVPLGHDLLQQGWFESAGHTRRRVIRGVLAHNFIHWRSLRPYSQNPLASESCVALMPHGSQGPVAHTENSGIHHHHASIQVEKTSDHQRPRWERWDKVKQGLFMTRVIKLLGTSKPHLNSQVSPFGGIPLTLALFMRGWHMMTHSSYCTLRKSLGFYPSWGTTANQVLGGSSHLLSGL